MDKFLGSWEGKGGARWDDGPYHGMGKIPTLSSLNYPHEHIEEDRIEKLKKSIDVGPWPGYGESSWDEDTYHGVREITIKGTRSEKHKSTEVGPWGGYGGTSWDDGTYHGVREIALVFGDCIDSIRMVYDKDGMAVAAEKHGGVGGNQTAEIKLQYPDEYLVTISGYHGPLVRRGSTVIRSLTFKSNKRSFGPFGTRRGTPFSSPMDGGWIVGLKGRSSHHLNAIGCHVS